MDAHPVTIREDALIEEAIRLMTEGRLKRLPVVDGGGRFRGLISRDSLLRTGYGRGNGGRS
jgi:CBS domain-containing protein